MPWVPKHLRDVRWKIWHQKFHCRVRHIQTMSVDYIRIFGMSTTGDSQYDRDMANEIVDRMMTIVEMLMMFHEGSELRVVQSSDTKVIYDLISQHLQDWRKEIQYALNSAHAPFEDLLVMDKFAHTIYEHAKWHFSSDFIDSHFASGLNSIRRVSRQALLPYVDPATTVNKLEEDPVLAGEEIPDPQPKRESLYSIFNNRPEPAPVVKTTSRFNSTSWK